MTAMFRLLVFLSLSCSMWEARSEENGLPRILLLGDSTTQGSVPRRLQPEGPHLEQVIERLTAARPDLPACRVINSSQGGEYVRRLLDNGRYDAAVAVHADIDFIFVRYGINDHAKREHFEENFPVDLRELVGRLRKDHPGATIIPTTVIPFSGPEASRTINDLIRKVSGEEGLAVFDLYTRYEAVLEERGRDSLNYRRYPLKKIPEEFHEFVAPRVHDRRVEIMGNEWDALFGHLPGWFGDRHPNLAGYNVIAIETIEYLKPLLEKFSAAEKEASVPGGATQGESRFVAGEGGSNPESQRE